MIFRQSKSKILKALLRKAQSFAIDFVNMLFYGEEKTRETPYEPNHARNQTILRLRHHITDKKEQTPHINCNESGHLRYHISYFFYGLNRSYPYILWSFL